MNLVIISGPEATGKSQIGHELTERLGYTYLGKDQIKEKLFDSAAPSTWDYKWYENEAKQRLFAGLERLIASGTDCILESNFIGQDKMRISRLLPGDVRVVELYCTASGLTSFKRFFNRYESGRRHKGHHDRRWYAKVFLQDCLRAAGIDWPYGPTGLTDKTLKVETSDFSKVDLRMISQFVRST